jgi:ABC-type phosphate/phosphonate transport system substrate-binding protein
MIACTRMYNVNGAVEALWRRLLEGVAQRADLSLDIVRHPAPAPLSELWARPDMACVFMCGWPYRRMVGQVVIVAAPVPNEGPCEGSQYCTNLVVRSDSPFRSLADTFGGRIAWTDEASHSGFNAPRRHLMHMREGRDRLYGQSIGPVVTPRAALMSVIEGRADIAPLDSYFHALLRRHEPDLAARVRVVDRTACTPIPPLVASANIPAEVFRRLKTVLCEAHGDDDLRELLDALCLERFDPVADPEVYALAERWNAEALAAGYPMPA